MRAAHRTLSSGAAFQAVMAGVLALLLLAASTLSVSDAFHRSFHHDGAVGGHLCLACSLAKGHASGVEVPAVLLLAVLSPIFWLCAFQESLTALGFDSLLPHGRAPPKA